ncbi:hypothetical protein Spb1_08250 [Planctopirus ephydatiae]|uniref:Uncharacterized protein n=1 Tax=Planctopirus ephydatiae TaxID=2528019 RepID=A0A518GK61_9PLAN|nr:hypothetical protein Spb1_08250 [Planctopirus ephydatiae]
MRDEQCIVEDYLTMRLMGLSQVLWLVDSHSIL